MSRTRSQPCTRRFPFHFVHINRMEKQGKRERGRERSATKAKRREQRGGGESRAQSVGVCPRPVNEIFISDAKEARLLSHFISSHISSRICLSPELLLLFTLSSSFFLFLSDIYCNSLLLISPCISPRPFPVPPFSILSELSPLVEVGQRFLFYLPGFSFPAFLPLEKTGNYKPITFFFFNTPTTSNYLCSRMSNRNSVCVSANLTRLTPLIR